jgi:hypothetical protein
MKNIDILKEVESELKRFTDKLKEAIIEQQDNKGYGCSHKKYAAVKRGALDLKNELTKLTQDSKYKYSK